jgi:hypothetical protein
MIPCFRRDSNSYIYLWIGVITRRDRTDTVGITLALMAALAREAAIELIG